ncbi:hypothetical protein E1298_10500 [Actinomadura rubrisoli]|uniref:Uncharacterized protein n=1 Tax=Actinomadura rubrisoli TaxID=2530368 RepID=A0A4R5C6K0_9ACTN|nr:hypothetical protein E1298_10500 [Actinomadura rubrisoli]
MGQRGEPTLDPGALSTAQRLGDACAVCRKRWPRPRVRVGRLPDSSGVFACDDCAVFTQSRAKVPAWRQRLLNPGPSCSPGGSQLGRAWSIATSLRDLLGVARLRLRTPGQGPRSHGG